MSLVPRFGGEKATRKEKGNNMIKKRFYPIIVGIICLILTVGLIAGNVVCGVNSGLITSFLCGYGFDEDGSTAIAARESGNALAEDVEEGGAVLLKNENNVLPLKNDKVNVFGFSGSDGGFMPQGTGSGTGSRNDLITFLGGLKEAGIEYNEDLAAAYDTLGWKRVEGGSYVIEAHGQKYKDFYGVAEAPESFYTSDMITNAKNYSDTAIVVIGRLMGEGNDFSKTQYITDNGSCIAEDSDRKLQGLSEREEYMLELVSENFENVIVVLNTGNPIELGIADNSYIDAVINMGMPGTRGTIGLANILKGNVSPSGKLADTWAYDLSTAAAYATSGFEGVGYYTDNKAPYTEYREDIYTGYYWYETADAEGFWDSDFAKERWNLKNGYEDVVQYPFGYGLSYTKFDWIISDSNIENGGTVSKDGEIDLEVKVTNTGDVAGRDVVELYYTAPYTDGGIEKSAIKLGAFAKTATLQPGQYETIKLSMKVSEMKSYDCYDRNNNGFMGYELEKGDYKLSLRSDVHTLKNTLDGVNEIIVKVATDIRYEVDDVTGEKVENQFTTYTNTVSGASSVINEPFIAKPHSMDGSENAGGPITYMTRSDFAGTFPLERGAHREAGDLTADMYGVPDPVAEQGAVAPEFGSKATDWTIRELFGVEYEDPMWDEIVSQLAFDRACLLIVKAGFGTIEMKEIGKPGTRDTDGPCGFNTNVTGGNNLKAVCYPSDTVIAQTWDWYIAYQVGVAIGIEGNALGIDGWYGPGANLHRSAMGGRNFEYYSEDALLAGIMCAYHVLGAKEKGVLAYIKHIGANEDDKGRTEGTGAFKWLTEQSFRENYLKPFELAIKIGGCNGLMGAATRTGGVRSTGSYAMLTAVVRNEWGFRGTVITDYYCAGTINDIDEGIRAGNSQVLHPDGAVGWFDDRTSDTAEKYIHKSAKDILYSYAATKYYGETSQGLESGSLIGTTKEVFPWWIPLLVAIDVTAVGLMAFWFFLAVRKPKKNKAEENVG